MREGLAAWEKLPENKRKLERDSDVQPQHRWEDSYPADGLVVNVISRDLPADCDPKLPCEVKWNQDYVWYSNAEARKWLGADPKAGSVHRLPQDLVDRLVSLHFVDNVKGQTEPFRGNSVEGSQIETEVLARTDSLVTLRISGETRGIAPASWWQASNGVATRLLGNAKYDLEEGRFVEFELVALGRRWGYTRFNGRRRDPDSGPLGYVFRLSDKDTPPIAPAWITKYNVDWVVQPTSSKLE